MLIATHPARPRESARLLVYDRRTQRLTHARIGDLPDFIPAKVALILNDTKVIKARLYGRKESGGSIEMLINRLLAEGLCSVYIRGRVREGTRLLFGGGLEAEVIQLLPDAARIVRVRINGIVPDQSAFFALLEQIGQIPLPPYMHRDATPEDDRDYQPLFARHEGSVAAPTASLHFTPELLQTVQQTHPLGWVTLHVGAGTFKPVEAEMITDHVMHSEYFAIPEATQELIDNTVGLLGVGSTATRTVEYYARTGRTSGECDLFLHPGNSPCRVNHLLTNFHLPASTLIMLVSAFAGRETTLALYREAVAQKYRFYSYGDAMLIL